MASLSRLVLERPAVAGVYSSPLRLSWQPSSGQCPARLSFQRLRKRYYQH